MNYNHNLLSYLISIFTLVFSANSLWAQSYEDVITTKNGSVIKGEIILHDFDNALYKIKLTNGQLITLSQQEISKITKSYGNQEQSANAVPSSTPVNDESATISLRHKFYPPAKVRKTLPEEWTIGVLRHYVKHDHNQYYGQTLTEKFKGIRFSHRRIPKSFSSFRTEIALATEEHTESLFDQEDKDYLSVAAYVTLGKQRLSGYQAYIGAGPYLSHYWMNSEGQYDLGMMITSSLGYKHKRLSALISGRYYGGLQSGSTSSENIDRIYSVSLDLGLEL